MGRPRKADAFGPSAARVAAVATSARKAAELAKDDREARDATFYEADAAGFPLREIARLAHMSVSHVQRIIVRETARRQDDALARIP